VKLFIQIPCYNEAQTLPVTLADLPSELDGIEQIRLVVIDDGSSDGTAEVARQHGVHHVVSHAHNLGLARAFMTGINTCLREGADIVVNTDADNQYSAESLPELIRPILEKRADLVIGARPISEIAHFSPFKKFFQKLGSWVVRLASKTDVPDAPSGFRALSREFAYRVNVFNNYTYTLETIIQAGQKNFPVAWVPVKTNPWLRPSRLFGSTWSYIRRSIVTIVRIFVVYRPFMFFASIGAGFLLIGMLLGIRFLYYFYFTGEGTGHIQSLILAGLLIGVGFQVGVMAFIGDLMSVNRHLLEELQYRGRVQDHEAISRQGDNEPS